MEIMKGDRYFSYCAAGPNKFNAIVRGTFAGLVFCFFASVGLAQPRIISAKSTTAQIKEYERAEWNIEVKADFKNPYNQQQVCLDMVMTSPSGKPVVLPCYFDKGTTIDALWKARFAPQESGTYQYCFRLKTTDGETESAKQSFMVKPSGKAGFLHPNNYWTFKFDNGKLFRGIGENIAWESRSFEDDRWTYDYLLPKLSRNGGNFFRTWMCYWNLPLEWQKVKSTKRYSNSHEYFNPGALKRMDELVNLTDSLGLYFMLTLDWHGHLIEDGGWRNSPYNQLNGGPCKTPADFFTMQAAQQRYKDKLRYIVARWGYSVSIAAFEFFNEVDNAVFTDKDSVIIPHVAVTEWHQEMSRYLKDIDPYHHMVTTSISHRDIIGLNSIAYIDFNQKHIYKHTEKIPGIYPNYIETYNKPYVVGEYGYRWDDDDPHYANEFNYDFKRGLWYGLFSPTPILPMSWWWELVDKQNMTSYIQSVREISDRMLASGKGSFETFKVKAGLADAYGVKCGNSYFVYLLNNTDHELTTDVLFNLAQSAKVESFTPETRAYHIVEATVAENTMKINKLSLPAKKEVVLIATVSDPSNKK